MENYSIDVGPYLLRISEMVESGTIAMPFGLELVHQPEGIPLQKYPPNQIIADFGKGSSVESESE